MFECELSISPSVIARQEKIEEGAFLADADRCYWSAEDIRKRASRSIFQDFAIGMITNASPEVLPKVLQLRCVNIQRGFHCMTLHLILYSLAMLFLRS